MSVKVKYCQFPSGIITPVTSKSISNRALIIQALTNDSSKIENLSLSQDTQTLIQLLSKIRNASSSVELNAGVAGTVMRFLISYCCLTGKEIILTGSQRMRERPISNLITALRSIGANIMCLEKEGFAPIQIIPSKIVGGKIELDASISSQFISSLLLCGPYFENGIEIKLNGKVVSTSYINLTIDVMKKFGVHVQYLDGVLIVKNGKYISTDFLVEGDWSSASYFYSLAALSQKAEIELRGIRLDSLQGDKAIVAIAEKFGVQTTATQNGILIQKIKEVSCNNFKYDFLLCPDIAQTVIPMVAALKIENNYFNGLSTLELKETKRITALECELQKFGVRFSNKKADEICMEAANFSIYQGLINTYEDHRMAMGFAPLAQKTGELIIENEATVKKSYPTYWEDLKSIGCIVENHDI